MITEDFVPTGLLRWSRDGKLQQQWSARTYEWRNYGGRERRVEGWKQEWRDVPSESSDSAGEKP